MTTGTCRLCLNVRPLCRSHIIPEFLYEELYDPRHRCFAIPPAPQEPERLLQKGEREQLLCQECETHLSVHERYICETFRNSRLQAVRRGNLQLFAGLNYSHIRLFFLSILWRMSISSLAFFRDVDLGPRAEHLRQKILADDPGEPYEYGFTCTIPVIDDTFYRDFILQPHAVRVDGRRVYRTVLGGLVVLYYVSRQRLPQSQESVFMRKDGSWGWLIADIKELPFLCEYFNQMAANQRLRAGGSE